MIFVGTGYNGDSGSLSDVETPLSGVCPDPANYPLFIRGTSGGVVNGRTVVCGGGFSFIYSDECYEFVPETNEWTLVSLPKSLVLDLKFSSPLSNTEN